MRPIDFSDRRTRYLALIALLSIGLGAGIEAALWMRGGPSRLKAGPARAPARVSAIPKRAAQGMAYEDLLELFARHSDDPSARAAASELMKDPRVAKAWEALEDDHDVEAFADSVKAAPAYKRFTSSQEFGRLSSALGSDPKSSGLFSAFGVAAPPAANQDAALAAVGPLSDGRTRVTSGGPIGQGASPPRPVLSSLTPSRWTASAAPTAAAGVTAAAATSTPAPGGASVGAAKGPGADKGAPPPEPKAQADSQPCPMQRVCSESAEGACPARKPPSDFDDARRQACACAIEELKDLMKADGNGPLLAALSAEGGFTPLLRQVDSAMVYNARATGRCYRFRQFNTPDLREQAAQVEASVWRSQVRKTLRAFAEARGIPFREPGE